MELSPALANCFWIPPQRGRKPFSIQSLTDSRVDRNRRVLFVNRSVSGYPHKLFQHKRSNAVFGIANLRFAKRNGWPILIQILQRSIYANRQVAVGAECRPCRRLAINDREGQCSILKRYSLRPAYGLTCTGQGAGSTARFF